MFRTMLKSKIHRATVTQAEADRYAERCAHALRVLASAYDGLPERELLERYGSAFESYDIHALTALIQEDATQSMPPFDLWLSGRDDIFTWWFGPGIGCKGSKLVPAGTANGGYPAYGQYKPSADGGYEPWALIVLDLSAEGIDEMTFFLDTKSLFPLFGLPLELQA